MSASAPERASTTKQEAARIADDIRKWARWARNQEMQRILLAAAEWIEAQAKQAKA